MLSRLSAHLSNLLTKAKWALFYRLLFSLIFISPVIFLALFSYIRLQSESTSSILSQKKSLASLAATIVDERLDGMVDLGTSLATRPRFIEEIGKGNWTEAMNILGRVSNNFPSIERVVLYDPNANIKADMPAAGVTGQTRADKEWYIAIKRNWQFHVSGVYQRSAVPKINVVSIVIPVKTGNSLASTASLLGNKEQKVIGILQLQLNLEIFADWIKKASAGVDGFIYIVDQYGHIVSHPKLNPKKNIIDFSSVRIVQKSLKGVGGAELNYNPVEKEERVAAYEPVSQYGWGVVVTQPATMAFAERNKNLRNVLITYVLIAFLALVVVFCLLYAVIIQAKAEDTMRELLLRDELTGLNNHRGFFILAAQQIKIADRLKQRLALLYVDMDNMKWINDALGHKEGDQALIDTAHILKSSFRASDVIARLSGDEFVGLVFESTDNSREKIVERLQENLNAHNLQTNRRYKLSISFGITQYDPGSPCSLDELLELGDKLMYEQKQIKRHQRMI
ncbi:MAG: sensor domain-containing diguanylate cyclase [Proteobacteria bacterium]|nr:sensor domain-containing diguanylate cyclase [Pseudomonadota bacterium]